MKLNALITKSGMVALLASTMFMVACADNRGFDSIRVKSPVAFDKQTPMDEKDNGRDNDHQQNDGSRFISQEPKVLGDDEEKKLVDEVIDNTTITYTEGAQGQKEKRNPQEVQQEKEEVKENINAIISETKALDAKAQFLKGLSIIEMEGSTAEKKALEVNVVVEVAKGRGSLTAVVEMTLDKSTKKMAGVTSEVKWHQADLGVKTEVRAVCAGSAEDLCSTINVLLRLENEEKIQAFVAQFVRGANGIYVLDRATSKAIVGFEEAQNGVTREDKSVPSEEQGGDDQSEQGKDEQTQAEVTQPDVTQQKEETQGQGQVEETRREVTPSEGLSFRQAEAESMKKYEAYKAEQEKQKAAEKEKTGQQNQKSGSALSHRQAEADSMKKYEAYKAEQQKQAALKAEMDREAQRAKGFSLMGKTSSTGTKTDSAQKREALQDRKAAAQMKAQHSQQIEREKKALEELKKMANKKAVIYQRQRNFEKALSGEPESLPIIVNSAAQKQKAAQQKQTTQSHRQAEIESMKKLEAYKNSKNAANASKTQDSKRQQEIQNILKKNKEAN